MAIANRHVQAGMRAGFVTGLEQSLAAEALGSGQVGFPSYVERLSKGHHPLEIAEAGEKKFREWERLLRSPQMKEVADMGSFDPRVTGTRYENLNRESIDVDGYLQSSGGTSKPRTPTGSRECRPQ